MRSSCRHIIALIVGVALLSIAVPGELRAQAESDFDDQGQPVQQYGARASCESKTLPTAGFAVAQEVPGKPGECYWVRSEDPITMVARPEPRPDLLGHLRGVGDAASTLRLAYQFYETRLAAVEMARSEAFGAFQQAFLGCGADVGCMYGAVQNLQARGRQLDGEAGDALGALGRDIDNIRGHFAMPSDWPGSSETAQAP